MPANAPLGAVHGLIIGSRILQAIAVV
jgi:hypothetical protein